MPLAEFVHKAVPAESWPVRGFIADFDALPVSRAIVYRPLVGEKAAAITSRADAHCGVAAAFT